MQFRKILTLVALLFLSGAMLASASAQTPSASPVASPAADGWAATDARQIDVDGEPIALSPDGKWLAGTAEADTEEEATQVCAWDVETLTPTCAEVAGPVEPYYGNTMLSWAPDSSAFAFVSGSMPRLLTGDVFVFDLESGDITNLTNTGDDEDAPMYIGADWTDDGEEVVYVEFTGLGDHVPSDGLFRVNRDGGEPVSIPLPGWSGAWDILFPPLVTGDTVTFAVNSNPDLNGIWQVGLDGGDARQLVDAEGDPPIDYPSVLSVSPDGRYLNIVSISGLMRMEVEGTFFLLDTETTALRPLVSADDLNLISFGPDGATGLMTREVDGENRLVTLDLATGDVTPVANSPAVDVWLKYVPAWTESGATFLPGAGGGTLVTLAPAS